MTPEEILAHPPRVLSQAQRESYFEHGYVLVEGAIPMDWIERLRAAIGELLDRSRDYTESDSVYDLEPGHTADSPRLRRITNPSWQHPVVWEYASESIMVEVVADLIGPNVKFLDTQMNFKWARGGEEIRWHQDMPYFPHTNYNVLSTGTFLEDVGPDQAPMGVIPGSQEGELFNLYGEDGQWSGHILDSDLAGVDLDRVTYLTGPAGTLQVHSARTVHASARNNSDRGRPILIGAYAAADAFGYVPYPVPTPYLNRIVRGEPARYAHHDPRPCPIPPDWSKGRGYQSIFTWQQDEAAEDEGRLVKA